VIDDDAARFKHRRSMRMLKRDKIAQAERDDGQAELKTP